MVEEKREKKAARKPEGIRKQSVWRSSRARGTSGAFFIIQGMAEPPFNPTTEDVRDESVWESIPEVEPERVARNEPVSAHHSS